MSTSTPAIQIVEPSIHDGDSLRKVPTNGSLPAIDEDKEHKQDWTITTDEKDSWAHKERRRSSVWGKLELVPYVPSLPSLRQFPPIDQGKKSFGSDIRHDGVGSN